MISKTAPPLRLLVVEDDPRTGDYISRVLGREGHSVDLKTGGGDGLKYAVAGRYDVLIVDRMLPERDGLSLVKAAREAGVQTPVLFLTALGGVDDRVEGLEAGGDDYVVKPFAEAELMARVNALARRPAARSEATLFRAADLELNLITRRVTRAGQPVDLQPREFKLLEVLMRHMGRVMTRTMLLADVWDFHFDPKTNIVETHISRLRDKVDKPFGRPLIHTVRGAGYVLDDAA